METDTPSISIILPVLNEVGTIDLCLESIAAQDYKGTIEILVADGGSTDGTIERLEAWQGRLPLEVVPNPHRVQSMGCNLAAKMAAGDYIVRMDAHTTYEPDYISRSMETLAETGADAVGGPMVASDDHPFGLAVAAAMDSKLMAGPAAYRHATRRRRADTVYLGTFKRDDFLDLGGYRSFPANVAEDADFYHRWRTERDAVIIVDPEIRSTYAPRRTVRGLWRQYFRYGQGKAEMMWANGQFPSWRPFVPAVFVLAMLLTGIWALLGSQFPLIAVVSVWLVIISSVAALAPASTRRVIGAAAVMQVSYGLGLWWGLLRGPKPVRALLSASHG